ncbi:hypothetical protein Vafri_9483 [Volvox africanus]|uniref:Protein kinase domain-containing protein n=1 Tax=Volvox africanus TaxID=51714 RepID=A0A8J4B4C6_9CHLO|nr:hypothetical protein Vafri_9483 [Volvox africanus]
MYDEARFAMPGNRLGWLCACALLLSVLRYSVVLAQTIPEPDLWQLLQSQPEIVSLGGSPWRWLGNVSVKLRTSVIIAGPGSLIIETPNSVITGSGDEASLTLRDITLFYNSTVLRTSASYMFPASYGPFPAFNGSSLKLTFINVTVIAQHGTLRNISGFWSAPDLLAALQPQYNGVKELGPQRLQSYSLAGTSVTNMLLLPSNTAVECFSGGVVVSDSLSLREAMDRTDVSSIFVYKNITLMPMDFNYSLPVNISGNRSINLYGCPGTRINTNYNYSRFGVQISASGTLSLSGLIFDDSPLVNQLFWPHFLAPLLGLIYVGVGGGCSIQDSTINSPDGSDLQAYLSTFSKLTAEARPVYSSNSSNSAVISSWDVTGGDVWETSPGVTRDAASTSFWRLRNVSVVTNPPGACLSSNGTPGINVDTGRGFKDLINDTAIPAIRIVGDIKLLASEWPPEASGPAGGQINVTGYKEVFACHPVPGERYTIDFGNLGQVVFVFGKMHFRGSLLLTHPKPSPRRSWLYLLIGALSVETDGIIQFDGVEIRGNTSSPFTNASDPFWNYLVGCGSYCSGFIPPKGSYVNVSHYDAFIFQYRFNKTAWVAASQNRLINGTGFWGYTDVALTWRPDDKIDDVGQSSSVPVAAIAVPVAVGGSLLLVGVAGLVFLRKRRSKGAAAARAMPSRDKSEQSYGRSGDPLSSSSKLGPQDPNKESSTPPQGSSTNAVGNQLIVGPNSTTSQGTSMLSASAPTEARIEDMKRVLTAHNILTGTHRNEQITLTELLGEGTFGKVYRGTWRGTTVAVKTMVLPTNMSGKEKREKMAVMETAISSSLSHPNIVQTYTYAVLPVKGDGNQMDTKLGAGTSMTVDSTSPLAAMSSADAQNVHSWEVRLVLEYCDRGSLRDVLNEAVVAALQTKGRSDVGAATAGGGGVDAGGAADPEADGGERVEPLAQLQQGLAAAGVVAGGGGAAAAASGESCPLGYAEVLDNCLDVARAMLHMHSENIVHGDLKARNILLKTGGVGDGRSYVAKVADFGLSLRIDPHETHVSNVYQGTITHMAPEVLLHGKVSKMSDVYAFAILMWQTYTAGQAFKGTPRALLGHEVTKMNRRPPFPLDTPFEFQLLACRCWESDPSIRPTFEQIIGELTRMRTKLAKDPGSHLAAPMGPPLSGSLRTETATAAKTASAAPVASAPPGGDSLMTASTAALPMMPTGGVMQFGHGRDVGEGIQQSVTLNSNTFTDSAQGAHGLFYLQGVDGSTMASQTSDGLNASPGAFTIGARPPFGAVVGQALGGALPARLPPPMPPILETNAAQQQQQE